MKTRNGLKTVGGFPSRARARVALVRDADTKVVVVVVAATFGGRNYWVGKRIERRRERTTGILYVHRGGRYSFTSLLLLLLFSRRSHGLPSDDHFQSDTNSAVYLRKCKNSLFLLP